MKSILSQVALAPVRAVDSFGNAIFHGKTFGNNSGEFDAQGNKIHQWLNYINKCSSLPTHQLQNEAQLQEELKDADSRNVDMEKFIADANLRWEVNKKLAQEELKKVLDDDEEFRKKANNQILPTQYAIEKNKNEVEDANQDAMKYRILGSLVFFGVLDILEIAVHVCEAFGLDKFEDGVKAVLENEQVMDFMAKVNQVLRLGDVGWAIAQFPIVNDLNQLVVDLAKCDLVSPFTEIAGEALGSKPAEYALNVAILLAGFNEEVRLNMEAKKKTEEGEAKLDKLEPEIMKMADEHLENSARSIIETETKANLNRIDFKVLQNIRNRQNQRIDANFKKGLEECKIQYNDSNGQIKQVSAYDLLTDKTNYDDEKYLQIMHSQSKKSLERLTAIVKKNSDTLDGDSNIGHLEHRESRRDLLLKSLENLNLTAIKNALSNLGDNAQNIGNLIKGDEEGVQVVKEKKEDVVNQIMNLGRGDVDKIIIGMATERTNVNIRIAKILTHEHKVIEKPPEPPESPVDFISSEPPLPPAPTSRAPLPPGIAPYNRGPSTVVATGQNFGSGHGCHEQPSEGR